MGERTEDADDCQARLLKPLRKQLRLKNAITEGAQRLRRKQSNLGEWAAGFTPKAEWPRVCLCGDENRYDPT